MKPPVSFPLLDQHDQILIVNIRITIGIATTFACIQISLPLMAEIKHIICIHPSTLIPFSMLMTTS